MMISVINAVMEVVGGCERLEELQVSSWGWWRDYGVACEEGWPGEWIYKYVVIWIYYPDM